MGANEFISVAEARAMIGSLAGPLTPVRLPLKDVPGLTLAEDVYAPADIPAYDQSSMDGYAIYFMDISEALTLQGVMAAGVSQPVELLQKHAMRIFTGAPLPAGADTVVMQEKVSVHSNHIRVENKQIEKGTHVRPRGADLKKGDRVLLKGVSLSPARIGLLAGSGVAEVNVFPAPAVTIIATGKEFQQQGKALGFGQVYESNTHFLTAALQQASIRKIQVLYADDELKIVQDKLARALETSDLVLLTGGVSVGDYDFVRRAADLNGIRCRFHKVRQRPGKPFYFGTKGNQLIFGLPGNPASVITCFYEYVLPAIGQAMERPEKQPVCTGILKEGFRKAEGLTQFLKGYLENGTVSILAGQESFRLRSFSEANCLVSLDEQRLEYEKGERVTLRLLPV